MRYWLVMPAAGAGRRFGDRKPKQYASLQGRTVIEWSLAPFLADPSCAGVVVSLAASDPYWPEVAGQLARHPEHAPDLIIAGGGVERSQSVRKGLAALGGRAVAHDWVLVHDAARPCLAPQDLQKLLERVASHPVGGLLATPAADTLKRSTGEPRQHGCPDVEQTVDRTGLWRALTPQMFRYELLCDALDRALAIGRLPTDEAQALEWIGEKPLLVEGSASNIKITSADDLLLAAALLKARASTHTLQEHSP
ncbi:MAG: ispD [Gammaproteobacteria bacterium]|nr:ispD [Gammaproteobacteria bacterium]